MATSEEYDVCVIGTGAGGGVVIDQLTAAGMRVVALERGPELSLADFDDDELRNVIRNEIFAPNQLETYRSDPSQAVEQGRIATLAHCVGGTMTHWAAWSWRFRQDDFEVLSKEGSVQGASLADWPISYEELAPYYEKAESDFGVAGDAQANPFAAPRSTAYPNPPHPERASARHFNEAARKSGYTPFPVPMGINSQPYGGRPGCMYGGACRAYGCPIHAKATTFSVSLPRAVATGKLDLRPDAMVYELPLDAAGRVRGARYFSADGTSHEVRARRTIVAAGSIGTAQLLLLSKSKLFPNGLANGSGEVGRNYTFHHHPSAIAVLDEDMRAYTGLETHSAFDDLYESDPKRGFIRGGVVGELNTMTHQPIAFGMLMTDGLPFGARWGAGLKERLRAFPRTLVFAGICEELPKPDSRIELDEEVVDRFGLAVPRITKTQHPNDLAMYRWYEEKLLEVAQATGARHVVPGRMDGVHIDENTSQKTNAHNHGTCRMGNNAAKSVVDKDCRSHEVPNLFVVDGSVMPTGGGYNPTLTILANAYRVADRIIEMAKAHEA